MTSDLFKGVLFNAGQELRGTDLGDTQKFSLSRLMDQVLAGLAPGLLTAAGDPDMPAGVGMNPNLKWAYAINPGWAMPAAKLAPGTATDKTIKITAGTLLQKLTTSTGNEADLLPFSFDGTNEYVIGDGHATLPRVDLLQMKLEWEDGDLQARVFSTEAEYAKLAVVGPATLWNTVLRARVKGFSGNNIQIRSITGGALAYSEVGNLITITYVSGVTTVLQVEAIIVANTTLLGIDTVGTAANILTSPGDTFAYTALAGGIDTVLVSQNMNMKRRVKATLSVKVGVAAAAPVVFPAPDAGYVPVAAIAVPALWIAGATGRIVYEDHTAIAEAGILYATLMDLRMPLNVKRHVVHARDCIYDDADWKLRSGKTFISPYANEAETIYVLAVNGNWQDTEFTKTSEHLLTSVAGGTVTVNIPTVPGMIIKNCYWQYYGNGTVDATIAIWVKNSGTNGDQMGTSAENNIPAAWGNTTFGLNSPANYETVSGDTLMVEITAAASGLVLGSVGIEWAPKSSAVLTDLAVPCPAVTGRLVGISITSAKAGQVGVDPTNAVAYLSGWDGVGVPANLQRVGGFVSDLLTDVALAQRTGGLDVLELPAECQSVVAKGSATYGPPIWTNGVRSPFRKNQEDGDGVITGADKFLILRVSKQDNPNRVEIYKVTFFIAEGI